MKYKNSKINYLNYFKNFHHPHQFVKVSRNVKVVCPEMVVYGVLKNNLVFRVIERMVLPSILVIFGLEEGNVLKMNQIMEVKPKLILRINLVISTMNLI